jgi:hypothetical protein
VKKLSLLFLMCMVSMLAFAQTDSSTNQTPQDLSQEASSDGVTLSPSSSLSSPVDVGNQPIDSPAFTPFILTTSSTITVSKIAASNPYSVYPLASQEECPSGPFQLNAGASCIILVKFKASAAGEYLGTLTVTYGAGKQQTAYLTAIAIYDVTLIPQTLPPHHLPCTLYFTSCTVTLINQLPVTLPIDIAVSDVGDNDHYFSLSGNDCGTQISPLASCTITVVYAGLGLTTEGELTVTTNPNTSPQTQSLYLLGCRKYGGC